MGIQRSGNVRLECRDGCRYFHEGWNDMLQPGQERQYKAILEAVQNGTLDEAILNRNVKRILELVVKCHTLRTINMLTKQI